MKLNCVVFVFMLTSFLICASTETSRNTQVDLIIQRLKDQVWSREETQCIQDTFNVLNNVKNYTLWAVWIWNSNQYPSGIFYGSRYSLGNYDQCLKAPSVTGDPKIVTQYCLADVNFFGKDRNKGAELNAYGTTDDFLKIKSKVGRVYNIITWGTCLPASCNRHAVTKILKTIYLGNPLASADPEITIDNCQIAGEKTVYSTQFYAFLTVMASLIVAAISSTIYLQYTMEDTKLTRVVYSFSLQRNWNSFIRTKGDEIPFLSFMKTFHLVMTTCSHCFVFAHMGAIVNGVDFDYYFIEKDNMLLNFMHHLNLPSIENFFVIGGILVMKHLMEQKRSPIVFLIQRYIRLIGAFTVLVFYTIAVSKYTGDGPLWNKLIGREHKSCEETWIWSLLLLSNYVNNERICQLVAWYVPCDYQLAIMATVLFCIWKRNKAAGKITIVLASFLALVLPGIATYSNHLPAILMYDVEQMRDARKNVVYLDTHMKSHHRAGPYIIGMGLGYILTVYKPAKYRGVISRGWSYIGFIAAGILGFRVWTSAAAWCLGEYNPWNSAIYATFSRNIWAISTCLCIAVAEYGDIPKLQSIFAWPGFVIFSRLAYGVYITHSLILQRNFYSQRNPMSFDLFSFAVTGLGVLLASSVFAVLLWLFLEAPLSNLTNLILDPRKETAINAINNENTKAHKETNEIKNGKHL